MDCDVSVVAWVNELTTRWQLDRTQKMHSTGANVPSLTRGRALEDDAAHDVWSRLTYTCQPGAVLERGAELSGGWTG